MMLRCALRAAGLAAQRLPAALASTPAGAAGCAASVRMLTATCAPGAPAAGLASELQRLAFLPVSVRALHGSVRTVQGSKSICRDFWLAAGVKPLPFASERQRLARSPAFLCRRCALCKPRCACACASTYNYKLRQEQTWCACL